MAIPLSVQATSANATSAAFDEFKIEDGIKKGEDPAKGELHKAVEDLVQLTKQDPSLRQYLSHGVQALVDQQKHLDDMGKSVAGALGGLLAVNPQKPLATNTTPG